MIIRAYKRYVAPILIVSAAFLFGTELLLTARDSQQAPPPQSPQTPAGQSPVGQPPAGQPAGQPPGGGRGGGRGNAGAALFTATCSGCHGTPELTGRAPYLFDQKWLDA